MTRCWKILHWLPHMMNLNSDLELWLMRTWSWNSRQRWALLSSMLLCVYLTQQLETKITGVNEYHVQNKEGKCMWVYVYVCVSVYVCMSVCMCVYVYMSVYMYVWVCIVWVYMCVSVWVHVYECVCECGGGIWMFTCMWTHGQENQGLMSGVCLHCPHLGHWGSVSLNPMLTDSVSQLALGSPFCVRGLQVSAVPSQPWCWVLGTWTRTACLHDKSFTCWDISPACGKASFTCKLCHESCVVNAIETVQSIISSMWELEGGREWTNTALYKRVPQYRKQGKWAFMNNWVVPID